MTKATLTGLLGGLTALLALALPLRAEEASTPHTYVVLVGVSKYADPAIKPRLHAEDDVKALYDLFTNKEYLGVAKENVKLLTGEADAKRGSEPATKENILKAAKWVADKAKRDDLVLLAFVGQGAALGDRGDRIAYFASDSTVKDAATSAVMAAALGDELDKLKSHRACMFVDVYFKGYTPAKGAPADPNAGSAFFKEFLGKDSEEEGDPAPGRVLFLATGGRFPSPDDDKHGAFTQVLLDGLKGKADTEGYEPDGVVTVDELTAYLNKEFPALVKKHVANEKERPRHAVIAAEDAHAVLTYNPVVEAKVKERVEKFRTLAKDNNKLTPEILEEGKALLNRMPKVEARRNLRKEYQALADGKEPVDKFLDNRAAIIEGMKLPPKEARDFAEKVLDAIEVIKKDYVKDVSQGQMVDWAVRGLYVLLDEELPDDVAKKLAKVKVMKSSEQLQLLVDVRKRLGKREDLDKHKDIDHALLRMLKHLDPYTTFYTPDEVRRVEGELSGLFIGVGIQIRKDPETDQLLVITPILGSPAYKAGVRAGDIITTIIREVDSTGKPLETPEVIPTKGLDTSDAVKKIQGEPGTKVKLTVQRPGVDKPIEFEMARRSVQTESVLGFKRKADAGWDYWVDPGEKIAYLRMTQFQRGSTHDMVEAMAELKKQGVKGLVLDLRFNPGGYLDVARDISDLFIEDGVIVEIRPRVGDSLVMKGHKDWYYIHQDPATGKKQRLPLPSYTDFPMACLINSGSASASEIVSACLQDHRRALIVGERSYGKGSVQNVVDFEKDGTKVVSKIKLTTASFWRPSKKNLNKLSTPGREEDEWGVTPDKVIKLQPSERGELIDHQREQEIIRAKDQPATDEKKDFKDRQLDAALEYLRGQIKTAKKAEDPKKTG